MKNNNQLNAMDVIDTEINASWPNWEDYSMRKYFVHIATLTPNAQKESLEVEKGYDPRYAKQEGLCYALVIDGKFVKQGKTDTTMKNRVQSYNCGKNKNREKGTCSVSNYKCLQSILAIGKPVEVYALFVPPVYFDVFGERVETMSSPAKYIEKRLNDVAINNFNGKLPWCVQR